MHYFKMKSKVQRPTCYRDSRAGALRLLSLAWLANFQNLPAVRLKEMRNVTVRVRVKLY